MVDQHLMQTMLVRQRAEKTKIETAKKLQEEADTRAANELKKEGRLHGEKVFIQMVINDYICKGKTWEDLQKDFRPSGAMSKWTRDTAELLGLKTTTNYNLMSPLKGSMKKRRKKGKSSKARQNKPKQISKSKSKPRSSKSRRYKSRSSKSRLTKRK